MLEDTATVKRKLSERITTNFSKEQLEEFLGITIKLAGETNGRFPIPIYNMYDKDGNLLYVGSDINQVISDVFYFVASSLCENAEKDNEDAVKRAKEAKKEFEERQEKERERNMVTCPICFKRHPRGTHFHNS